MLVTTTVTPLKIEHLGLSFNCHLTPSPSCPLCSDTSCNLQAPSYGQMWPSQMQNAKETRTERREHIVLMFWPKPGTLRATNRKSQLETIVTGSNTTLHINSAAVHTHSNAKWLKLPGNLPFSDFYLANHGEMSFLHSETLPHWVQCILMLYSIILSCFNLSLVTCWQHVP